MKVIEHGNDRTIGSYSVSVYAKRLEMWRSVVLERLVCIETEDWLGDELRFEVFVDGTLQVPTLKRDVDEGDEWYVGRSYIYQNGIELKLWDEDSPDSDDLLGTVALGKNLVNHAQVSFLLDGADYELQYSIIEVAPPPIQTPEDALEAFDKSTQQGAWPHITRSQLVDEIRATLTKPSRISQKDTPFCGPAAVVYELASRDPMRYVGIVQELYETGAFRTRRYVIEPTEALLNSTVPPGMRAVDWMVLAAMRDAENLLFTIDGDPGDIEGITFPWEMEEWAFELLGYDAVDFESTFIDGELDAIELAQGIIDRGGVAFLLIDAAMLGGEEPAVAIPNHWISFLGNLSVTSDQVAFRSYSWGTTIDVQIGKDPFEDYMWGVVTAV